MREWRKARASQSASQCVELSVGPDDTLIRDTKARSMGQLNVTKDAFGEFLKLVRS